MIDTLTERTIQDFGDQWTRYTENDGYYGSSELLFDIFGPLLPVEAVTGKRVAEVGSGSGRIVRMLIGAGASHVTAVEPSQAIDVLRRNVQSVAAQVTCLHCRGDQLPEEPKHDLIVSIGVLHHIPDPKPTVAAAYQALRPGGQFLVWLYGWEGNAAYLSFVLPIRFLTTKLPHFLLTPLCHFLNAGLAFYIGLARRFRVPLRGYMINVIGRFSPQKRYLVIYDQLKPAYAKYYRKSEALSLLKDAGFADVNVYHRHGYSWTVVGRRSDHERSTS